MGKRVMIVILKILGILLFYALMLGTISTALLKKETKPKPRGELRINPVVNQLKQDLNGYYYKKESGSYHRLYPQ